MYLMCMCIHFYWDTGCDLALIQELHGKFITLPQNEVFDGLQRLFKIPAHMQEACAQNLGPFCMTEIKDRIVHKNGFFAVLVKEE